MRGSELRSLKPSSFELGENPTLTLEARHTKNRRAVVIQLTDHDLVRRLRDHLAHKLPTAQAFNLPEKAARMLRKDLARAGIPDRDKRGRVIDFHALRKTFVTDVVLANPNPKLAQKLARHASMDLTMNVYAEVRPEDERVCPGALAEPIRLARNCQGCPQAREPIAGFFVGSW